MSSIWQQHIRYELFIGPISSTVSLWYQSKAELIQLMRNPNPVQTGYFPVTFSSTRERTRQTAHEDGKEITFGSDCVKRIYWAKTIRSLQTRRFFQLQPSKRIKDGNSTSKSVFTFLLFSPTCAQQETLVNFVDENSNVSIQSSRMANRQSLSSCRSVGKLWFYRELCAVL